MPVNLFKLLFSVGVCLGAGVLGSVFTFDAIPNWYADLEKPFFSPPNFLFGPVWTTLYIMMGISVYLVWVGKGKLKKAAMRLFWIQLGLNAAWSIVFFGMRNPDLAFVNILFMWAAIFLTIKAFYPISKTASYLLMPYILWVSFASVLNLAIVILN